MTRQILVPVLAALLVPAAVQAGPIRHRHRQPQTEPFHRAASQEPYAGLTRNPYAGYTGPGSEVLNATVRAEREPGATLELAPDAKETATGGPVGGPPGFDGS